MNQNKGRVDKQISIEENFFPQKPSIKLPPFKPDDMIIVTENRRKSTRMPYKDFPEYYEQKIQKSEKNQDGEYTWWIEKALDKPNFND